MDNDAEMDRLTEQRIASSYALLDIFARPGSSEGVITREAKASEEAAALADRRTR